MSDSGDNLILPSLAAESCAPARGKTMLLSCSGGSNVGQLANQACIELTQEGWGQMSCLAGVGGKLAGFLESARNATDLVVIDGCEVGCARAIFAEAGVELRGHLVLTRLGIAKNKDLNLLGADIARVKEAVKSAVSPLA
ncbi:MAG: putative zinc-binding protein [Deltaproteobacteria bacterium]|nr:putative zinc-binding protein [Deltaproteobacteria bacterium]